MIDLRTIRCTVGGRRHIRPLRSGIVQLASGLVLPWAGRPVHSRLNGTWIYRSRKSATIGGVLRSPARLIVAGGNAATLSSCSREHPVVLVAHHRIRRAVSCVIPYISCPAMVRIPIGGFTVAVIHEGDVRDVARRRAPAAAIPGRMRDTHENRRTIAHGVIADQNRVEIRAPVEIVITTDMRIITPARVASGPEVGAGKGTAAISVAMSVADRYRGSAIT